MGASPFEVVVWTGLVLAVSGLIVAAFLSSLKG